MPSEIAASSGLTMVPARAPTTPHAATGQNRGAKGITRQVAVTTTTLAASSSRLALMRSTSAQSGPCTTSPVRPPNDNAKPMLSAFQPCSVIR